MKAKGTHKTLKVAVAAIGLAATLLMPTGCATAAGGGGGGGLTGGTGGNCVLVVCI